MMGLNCSCNKKQRIAYIEDLLLMYEQGTYNLSTLTIMLLECPDLNVADFLRSSKYQEIRSQEADKVIESNVLVDFVRRKLVELYSANTKLSSNLTAPATHHQMSENNL